MAIITVSLDTSSRKSVLTIDGTIIPASEFYAESFIDPSNGVESVRFAYTLESVNEKGLKERRHFYLPQPDESVGQLNAHGMVSGPVYDASKAQADIINFLKCRK